MDLGDTILDETDFNDDTLAGFEAASLTGGASGNDMDASAFTGGTVTLVGLAGSDTLVGSASSGDSLDAGADTDRITANEDVDFALSDTLLAAGADSDSIAGFDEASLEGGGAGNDFDASGFSGPVTMFGYNGDDSFIGGASSDLIVGGNDSNALFQSVNADQTLVDSLVTGDGSDSISFINSVSLVGGASPNTIDASALRPGRGQPGWRGWQRQPAWLCSARHPRRQRRRRHDGGIRRRRLDDRRRRYGGSRLPERGQPDRDRHLAERPGQ